MRFLISACVLLAVSNCARAQEKAAPSQEPKSITVPAVIDHNRVVISVDVPLPNGSAKTVHAWVDNGNPDLEMSRRLATLLGLTVTCSDKECSAPPPERVVVGGMTIPLSGVKETKIPLKPVTGAAVMAAGMDADISIPASVLRHYDVLVDFPGDKFSIGLPGTIHFLGSSAKVQINPENGLIQVPSKLENKKYNLALDLGASISFLSDELFEKMASTHPDWPHMTGAVGSANMFGSEEETQWKVMRVDRVQFGPLFLTNVAAVALPQATVDFFQKRAGLPTAGLIGSNVLLNYRVGLDYAHSMVYFDIGRMFNFPDFDVIGLVLRPDDDGRYTILGVTDFEGKPSVSSGADGVQPGDHLVAVNGIPVRGSTMGQVWSMLGGTPGQERVLTVERAGREFTVAANVQHFLGEAPEEDKKKKK